MLIILILILSAVAIMGLAFLGFISFVKSESSKKNTFPTLEHDPVDPSKMATCSRCGQRRIIVKSDDTLCAGCYSALRTKKIG